MISNGYDMNPKPYSAELMPKYFLLSHFIEQLQCDQHGVRISCPLNKETQQLKGLMRYPMQYLSQFFFQKKMMKKC
ncbi:hypothetical protein AAZX31_19G117800 [Glycine max]